MIVLYGVKLLGESTNVALLVSSEIKPNVVGLIFGLTLLKLGHPSIATLDGSLATVKPLIFGKTLGFPITVLFSL